MKLITIARSYPTHLEAWLVNFIDGMERQKVDVDVVSLSPGENPYNEKIDKLRASSPVWVVRENATTPVIRALRYTISHLTSRCARAYIKYCLTLKASPKEKIKAFTLLPGIEVLEGADILHFHSEKSAFYLLPLLTFLKVKFVVTFHGLEPYGVKNLSQRSRSELYSLATHVIVNTQASANHLAEEVGLRTAYSVIPQGIDTSWFTFQPKPAPRNRTLKILTVGRLDKLKGYDYVIESLSKLKQLGHDFTYTIVGSGLYRQQLERHIHEKGLCEHIYLTGPQVGQDLLDIYHQSDIFILPSITEPGLWFETQGIVLQEAQSCGVITLASNSGGIPECVSPYDRDILFEPRNSEDILEKLLSLITNKQSWPDRQKRARLWVEDNYGINKMSTRLLDAYQKILKQD